MNIYLIGVIVSMIVYLIIGMQAGKSVKDVNDYYVAGRNAPTILITGSLVASFLSTGAFLGDTGEVYSGFFIPIVIVGVLQGTGYLFGSTLFGRYVRRSKVLTIGEYFGKRFCDNRIRVLAGVTTIIAVTAYMMSAIQGVSTLLSVFTGLSYQMSVLVAWLVFAFFTIWSGSSGVLITDTIMFLVFLVAAIIGIPFIVYNAGGWMCAIEKLVNSTTVPGIISAGANLEYMYPTAAENLTWSVVYGIVWALVVMVSPWQTSRYLMAKNEKVVMKSAIYSSIAVILVTMLLYFSAAFVQSINSDLEPSQSMIWAAMNLMPALVGVIFLTGILAAGISSASTFLSLIGFSLTNDIFQMKDQDVNKNLHVSRWTMVIASVFVFILTYLNPPRIFWIMYFGGAVIAASWAVIAIASVWSKKLSAQGAFLGMLFGFIVCAVMKAYNALSSVTLPMYLDPFFFGILASIIGAIVGTKMKPKTDAEQEQHDLLYKSDGTAVGMKKYGILYLAFAGVFVVLLIIFYLVPYMQA